jgi:hypothetical protein
MVSKRMIDIVTVVFKDELPILKVQAESVDLYCKELGIQTIFVIVNDDDSVADLIDPGWWGSLQSQVQIIPRSSFACQFVENGWVSQQVLKLLGSSLSRNTWSMLLDAKTLVSDCMTSDIFVANSDQLTLGIGPVLEVFEPAAKIASDLFGITVAHVAQPAGVPFIFRNQDVRQLIDKIETMTHDNFAEWFQRQGMLTEFVLYTAFIQYKYQDLSQVYLGHNQIKLCNNICHSELKIFDIKLQHARDCRPLTVGVHRNAWRYLNEQQKQSYRDYLESIGLTTARSLQ